MDELEKSLAPQQPDGTGQDSALEPTGAPEEFGFPEKPTIQQLTAWHNQERFLQALVNNGCLKYQAAEACGLTVWAVERWDSTDLYGFKKRYQTAKEKLLERYEASCDEDALIGVEKPVMHKGEVVLKPDGTPYTHRVRDSLTRMFRMKKLDPSYRDNYQPQQSNTTIAITQTVIRVHDYRRERNQGEGISVIESQSREIPAEGPSRQVGEDDKQ
jgi:hypothetical protein